MSSFAKFRLEGKDAQAVLQRIMANDVDVEPGRVVYGQWLNNRGCIEADLTATRLSETAFLIVTSAASATRASAFVAACSSDRTSSSSSATDLAPSFA